MKHETPGKSRRYAKLYKINRMALAQVGGNGRKAFPIYKQYRIYRESEREKKRKQLLQKKHKKKTSK